ncbi:hypothetical protein F4678DRAFT_197226 [Xylaria arbuscula]|nr:hypothetical protein F4678DRAFT_197226 [Xylaria arbuscula]
MNGTTSHPAKNLLCRYCNHGFSRREHLQRHERSHTKEKPFRCLHCPKAFTRKDLLTRHLRLSHATPPEIESFPPDGQSREGPESPSTPSLVTQTEVSPPSSLLSSEHHANRNDSIPTFSSQYTEPRRVDIDNPPQKVVQGYHLDFNIDGGHVRLPPPPFAYDFASFIDTVPNPIHPFSPTYQPLPVFFPELDFSWHFGFETQGNHHEAEGTSERAVLADIEQPATAPSKLSGHAGSSLSRYGSRLPSLQPEERPPSTRPHLQPPSLNTRHLRVSTEFRQQIVDELSKFSGCFDPDFVLPSRHTLSRLIGGYVNNFHEHYPFLHLPTLRLETLHVELVLAIAALGSRYTRDTEQGVELFHVARSIVLERIHWSQIMITASPCLGQSQRRGSSAFAAPNMVTSEERKSTLVEMIQTILLLIAIATWYRYEPGATDALSMRSVLHSLAREEEISRSQEQECNDWKSWVQFETIKRTQMVVFCIFNIHTILFDLPPMKLAGEVRLDLPCSETEWRADSESRWHDAYSVSGLPRHDFRAAFVRLFSNDDAASELPQRSPVNISALGGCGMIHAVIQQIWLTRNARLPHQQERSRLSPEEMNTFERALRRWATHWERNQESSLDPLSPHGPVTFTSTALLRLAYIRLNLNLGPVRSLESWDANMIAQSIHDSPGVERDAQLTRAALHCAHALSIPVKLGINYVVTTQLIHWSNQHALCSLECAILLAKWLESVTMPNPTPALTPAEHMVLDFVIQLVAEAEYKISAEKLAEQKGRLSAIIVRLWARLYQVDSVWQMVNVIGRSLNLYADLLELQT